MSTRKSRQLRRNRERSDLWQARFAREYAQYRRKARGWLLILDPEYMIDFAHHWHDENTYVTHNGRKP
jgi:hypothetical protein